jgi:hypothetical protein
MNGDPMLDSRLAATLEVLQETREKYPDFDDCGRTYFTIGVVESLLEKMSISSQFTDTQRAQLIAIVQAWNEAIGISRKED